MERFNSSVRVHASVQVNTPYSSSIPRTMKDNLLWRQATMERALVDPSAIEFIKQACADDPLFFVNGFVWTYDPRRTPSKMPMILYPFQERGLLELIEAIGVRDILISKSRDTGASWLCIIALEWPWLFRELQSFLFVSRVEEYVDKPGNPKALFWKFDFVLNNLPSWLRPKGYSTETCRSKMHVVNPENGSVIDGESTTGNVARGDRRTAILLDEFAAVEQGHRVLSSTRDATNCRMFNSTPAGTNNAYYDMWRSDIKKLRFHWSDHPLKNIGLYTTGRDGLLNVLDSTGYPRDYAPMLDGKLRSPWYDLECKRANSTQEIGAELDIDFGGSGYRYFRAEAIQTAIRQHARPPMLIGDLEYDDTTAEPIRFVENPSGCLRLWCLLDGKDKPPVDHKYSCGSDVSAGTGASNSCLSGFDMTTNAKTWEYVNPYIRPEQFAKQAVAICKWFGKAYLIWESGGPGRQFGSRVQELGYGNIYMRRRIEGISRETTDIPGFVTTKENKAILLGSYRAAVEKGDCVNRSREALEETLEYIFTNDGGIEHSREGSKVDPSGAKTNHGDRCMADALSWMALHERARLPVIEAKEVPVGSLAWRNEKRTTAKQLIEKDGW